MVLSVICIISIIRYVFCKYSHPVCVSSHFLTRSLQIRSFFFLFKIFFIYLFLYSRFLLIIHFIHISVYMSIPISQVTPSPSFPPLVSIHLFSTSVSLFLPCKLVHLYHFSRFHIYAFIYNICFSLSDLLHSV